MSEQQTTEFTTRGFSPAGNSAGSGGSRRRRMLAVVGTAAAVLAMSGLTACDDEGGGLGMPPGEGVIQGPDGGDEDGDADDTDAEDDTDADDAGDDTDAGDGGADGADDGFLAADESHTYPNGIEVTLSAAEEFTVSDYHEVEGVGYKMTATVVNNGDEDYESYLLWTARAGDAGVSADRIFDGANVDEEPDGLLKPGRTLTGEIAFEVPEDATFLDVLLEPLDDLDSEGVMWNLRL